MTSMTRPTARRTANALGWLSIGLGAAQLAGAGRLLGMMGGRRTGMTRFYGLREVATGIGLLTAADPTPWVWGRVGGDALDLASLVGGYGRGRPGERKRTVVLLMVTLIGAVDVASARSMRPRR